VALTALGWLWWRAWTRLGVFDATALLRGRRCTWSHERALCVPGVVLGAIHVHFAWQAWHSRHWAGSGGVLGPACLCLLALGHMNGVVLGAIHVHFAWQAWHPRHCIGSGDVLGPACARLTPRLVCVAGVALGDMNVHFAWQARTW